MKQTKVFYYYVQTFKLSELCKIIGNEPYIDINFIYREGEGIELEVIREVEID